MKEMKEKEMCLCDTPDVKVDHDDRGRRVFYCDRCWKPIEEERVQGRDRNEDVS